MPTGRGMPHDRRLDHSCHILRGGSGFDHRNNNGSVVGCAQGVEDQVRPQDVTKTITEWYRHIGRKGGSQRTEKQRTAQRQAAAKARKVLAEKRRLGRIK